VEAGASAAKGAMDSSMKMKGDSADMNAKDTSKTDSSKGY
jgi:hypothetical protein